MRYQLLNSANPTDFTEHELAKIVKTQWYEVMFGRYTHAIVILGRQGHDWLEDAEDVYFVKRIDQCLYRWSREDGFYHA